MPRTHASLRLTFAATRMRSPTAWVGGNLEVRHENQNRPPRRRDLSRSRVNVERASLLRRESGRGIASCAETKSCLSGLVAMTHVRAARSVDFKHCCMIGGEYDGSDRHYFFQRVGSSTDVFDKRFFVSRFDDSCARVTAGPKRGIWAESPLRGLRVCAPRLRRPDARQAGGASTPRRNGGTLPRRTRAPHNLCRGRASGRNWEQGLFFFRRARAGGLVLVSGPRPSRSLTPGVATGQP